jgi:putative phosphoesterase
MIRSALHKLDDTIDRLLIFSDIHGFVRPLEVIDTLYAAMGGRSQIVFNGDMCTGGLWPAEVMQWTRRNAGELAVLGNHDEEILHSAPIEGAEGEHLPIKEAGAYQRFCDEARDYFRKLPHRLVLSWRSKRIVLMHGHINKDGKAVSWKSSPEEQSIAFVESDADLCIMGHTHYAYVQKIGGTICANTGSPSLPFIAWRDESGIHPHSGKAEIGPDDDFRSTFLVVTAPDGELQVEIVRFDYDRQAELQDQLQKSSPIASRVTEMLQEGILSWVKGIHYD